MKDFFRKLLILVWMVTFFPLPGIAGSPLLKNFAKAQQGDYVVAYINKNYTLLHIFDRAEKTFTIEEVTVPSSHLSSGVIDWHRWMEKGAPRHTSWIMYEVEPSSGKVLESFSFTQQGWLELTESDNFFTTLLNLDMTKIPPHGRKRVGPAPTTRGLDRRKLWQPPLYYEGVSVNDIVFDAWRAHWPDDGTELADKAVEVYLPQGEGPYLSYFPYWIEVRDGIAKAKLRIKDSGRHLHSPKTELPRRPPVLLGKGTFEEGNLSFRVKTSPYYEDFLAFARVADDPWSRSIALPCQKEGTDDVSIVKLTISAEALFAALTSGQRYHFSFVPRNNAKVAAETPRPVLVNYTQDKKATGLHSCVPKRHCNSD